MSEQNGTGEPLIIAGEVMLASLRPEHDGLACPCRRISETHGFGTHRRHYELMRELQQP